MRYISVTELSFKHLKTGNVMVSGDRIGDRHSIDRVMYKRNIQDRDGQFSLGTHRVIGICSKTGYEVRLGEVKELNVFVPRPNLEIMLVSNKDKKRRISLLQEKKPRRKNKANYVGVEMEFISSMSRGKMLEQLEKANLHKYVNLTTDGSIRFHEDGDDDEDSENNHDNEHGYELRICAKEGAIEKIVDSVCSVLKRSRVNDSCGLHVHLDMRNRNVETAYSRLIDNMDTLIESVDEARLDNDFCKINTKKSFREHTNNGDRYWAVNTQAYDRHKTLEIRLHEGTLKPNKIKNWIKLLIHSVDTEKVLAQQKGA